MSIQLYNSNHERINPITTAESILLNDGTKVLTKIENIDTTLATINTDIEGINTDIINLRNDINNSVIPEGLNSAFKSIVFKRQNDKPDKPAQNEGSYDSPVPEGWSDGIPDGEAKVWMTSRIFSSDGKAPQQEEWTLPAEMTDTDSLDVEFSSVAVNPGNPSDNPDNWSNESNELTIWMATRKGSNGEWEPWQISKIKGEKGDDGTGVNIKGSLESEDELPESPNSDSDSYIIKGELWVWDGDNWVNVGNIKGEKGDTPHVHIKYANKATETTSLTFTVVIDGLSVQLTPSEGNGETPGNYIGVLANYIENDITEDVTYSNYTWTKWKGEDGFGYEYIYTLSYEVPVIPTDETNLGGGSFENNDFVPNGWYDNPCTPTESAGHCWICTRQKVDGVWQSFKGDPNNDGYASLYTKYTKDGAPGENALVMNLLEDSVTIPCYSDGTLIPGTHFGAGTDNTFTESIGVSLGSMIEVYYGLTDISNDCTLNMNSDTLSIYQNSQFEGEIKGFISQDLRCGDVTITVNHSTYGNISRKLTITKAYCGKDGEDGESASFKYYQINSSTNSITAIYNLNDNKFTAISPTSLTLKVDLFTLNGKETLSIIPDNLDFVAYAMSIEDIVKATLTGENGVFSLELLPTETAYVLIGLRENGIAIDTERISVLWKLTGVTAEMPDWVTNWSGETTEIAGNKVLTGKLYAGNSPTDGQTDWKGVLIGSNVASVENLPFEEYQNTTKDFSGILAVKNFDTNPGDNTFGNDKAEVTFALDAETGNAYFKGEVYADKGVFNGTVYATDGKFAGEIEATSGKFENGVITNTLVNNLTVVNDSDSYNIIIGSGTSAVDLSVIETIQTNTCYEITSDGYVGLSDTFDDGSANTEGNLQELDLINTSSLYNTIATTFDSNPYYRVKVEVNNPATNLNETKYFDAWVTTSGTSYLINYKSEEIVYTPVIKINCSSDGKTGSIQVSDLNVKDNVYSRTTMNGGSFTVEFNQSKAFTDSGLILSVGITKDGVQIIGIPTVRDESSHNYNKGVLYVDSLGIVRASDGKGGYITALNGI